MLTEILDSVGNLVEDFILLHAVGIMVTAKSDDHKTLVLGHYRLVDMPSGDKVRNNDGTHDDLGTFVLLTFE